MSQTSRALAVLVLCLAAQALTAPADTRDRAVLADEPIAPLTEPRSEDAPKIELGEALFRDPRLSREGAVACASCHRLDRGGADGRPRSIAADGRLLDFNVPTIFNVALNYRLNWRGNFRTLEEQNEAVLLDRTLMNTNWEELLEKLRGDQVYRRNFARVYRAPPDRRNVLDALAAYQRSLTTPRARFDRYLDGERDAITAEEEHGYQLFKILGCVACHQGANVGGNLFQKFGVFSAPLSGKQRLTRGDLGRFGLTGVQRDLYVFRVPSLRNVAATAPYFHDGRTASLEEAVEIMARSQLGRDITGPDVDRIAKFLRTLTGEYRGQPLAIGAGQRPQ